MALASTPGSEETPVPISMGSPRFTTRSVPGFEISDVWFPPDAVLPSHTHERPVIAICLAGRIESHLGGRTLDGTTGALWTEPAGDAHSNLTSTRGARVLAVLPDPSCAELLDPVRRWLEDPASISHPATALAGARLKDEVARADDLTDINLQALALGLLADAGRAFQARNTAAGPPAWLARAEAMVRDRFRDRLPLDEVAREVGVHPMHLTRVFRDHLGHTIPSLQRELRLDWAEFQIRTTEQPLGRIALQAGFSDQSHFTRVFKRYRGTTPGAIRRAP